MTPPQKWLLTPYKILSWRRFFFLEKTKKICPEKKFFAGLRRHQFLAEEGQSSHKNFSVGPPDPLF